MILDENKLMFKSAKKFLCREFRFSPVATQMEKQICK
jgi:hypothetical protein